MGTEEPDDSWSLSVLLKWSFLEEGLISSKIIWLKKIINNILVLSEDLAPLALWMIQQTLKKNEEPMVFALCIDVATELVTRYPQLSQLQDVTKLTMEDYESRPPLGQVSLVRFSMVLTD